MLRLFSRFAAVFCLGLTWCVAAALAADAPSDAAKKVDELLKKETLGSEPSAKTAPLVSDEVFLRRVHLDLVGSAPSAEAIVLFSLDPRSDKRVREVEQLLADKRYGENLGRYWRDVILYRRSEERALLASEACAKYLTEEFNKNTPWDLIATDFVTAQGDVTEKGETTLIVAQAGQPEDVVAEISRIFMGIQIQCAQCHDHPTDRWKREQFHQLAAFFPRVAVQPNFFGEKRTFTVAVNDSPFEFGMRMNNNRYRGTPEHFMPDKNNPAAKGTAMEPVFFVNQEKLAKGTKDVLRREALAGWLTSTDNEWFAKAFVNRTWSELAGEGFYEPVDDMGPDRQCSAEQTLNYLAAGFAANKYDVKWLYKTILSTDAYQRESRSRRDPEGTPFLANVSQRLRADQLFNNLASLLGMEDREFPMMRVPMAGGPAFRRSPRSVFTFAFGYDPSNPRDEIAGSIPQALVMMNSTIVNSLISGQRGTLGRILTDNKNDDDVTTELYLKTLAREPSVKELEICRSYVAKIGNRSEAFEDVLWSLINSTEFLHRR